jgi:amino-acid N-acetyltransferase
MLQGLLSQGIIPVVPPLGFDGDGKTYRVNSDAVALALASQLKAVKLLYLTTADGLQHQGRLLRQVLVSELKALLGNPSDLRPDLISKARHAVAACEAGVPRVHVINGTVDESLLSEVFSNEGIGTLVYANEYTQVRRAQKKDIRTLINLTKASMDASELMKRTRAAIERQMGDYYLFEIDKNPVGCVALHPYPETQQGELAFLYVSPSHENQGIGSKLVQFVEARARELGITEIFTLSTTAFTWFQNKASYAEATPDVLPIARRERYEASGRNSKILVKRLRPETGTIPLGGK